MPLRDMRKKADKVRDKIGIQPDEQVLAACNATHTNYVKHGAIGGALGRGMAQRQHDSDSAERVGLATRFVSPGLHVLVLTDKRLLQAQLGAISGNPKNVVAEWKRSEVQSISVVKSALTCPMVISFSDGSMVECDGVKGTDPESLAL